MKIVDKDNLVSAFSGFEVTREDLLKNLEKEIKIMGFALVFFHQVKILGTDQRERI